MVPGEAGGLPDAASIAVRVTMKWFCATVCRLINGPADTLVSDFPRQRLASYDYARPCVFCHPGYGGNASARCDASRGPIS